MSDIPEHLLVDLKLAATRKDNGALLELMAERIFLAGQIHQVKELQGEIK